MIMKMRAKKKFPHAGKLKHVRIEVDAPPGKGASVHKTMHPSEGNEYPAEEQSGSFSTKEEALHHAGKMMGADVAMEPPVGETNVAQNAGDAEEAAKVA